MTDAPPQGEPPVRRAASVGLAVALGVALSGYAVGRAQVAGGPAELRSSRPAGAAGVAPAWSELALGRRGPNAAHHTRVPETAPPARSAAPSPQSAAEREAALTARAARRAYDGAPPVVPHPVDPTSVSACLTCHEHGLRLGAVVAPALPHRPFTSCTQCHAPSAPPALAERARAALPPNGFDGLAAPAGGERAWAGAPPVMPHSTWMREACMSCHGPNGTAGLRTSHPWRMSCTQCHAARARSP